MILLNGIIILDRLTYSCMSVSLISLTTQPLKSSFDFKFHVF